MMSEAQTRHEDLLLGCWDQENPLGVDTWTQQQV